MKWCDRTLIQSPYSYGVCLDEEDYHETLRKLELPEKLWAPFVNPGKDATVHYWTHHDGRNVALVCIKDAHKHKPGPVVGILVHEAVHIWQAIKEDMGETNPSKEFEAYSIQWIVQELIESYNHANSKRTKKKTKI